MDRSVGTSFGMKRWYKNMCKCKECKKVHLNKLHTRDKNTCAGCMKKLYKLGWNGFEWERI